MQVTGASTLQERARERLIFALDVSTLEEADRLVHELRDTVGMFKVGKQLFLRTGPKVVEHIRGLGAEVFLDLKFHDIPQTVARASVEATRIGAAMFNVHASGSLPMMEESVRQVRRVCRSEQLRRPWMLAVTVLTSLSAEDLSSVGVDRDVEDHVVHLARLAKQAEMDGVVASPREIESIRQACGPRFLIVTPGIRRPTDDQGDQNRVTGPAEAIARGADYIVVGRPIRDAASPHDEAARIVEEIRKALEERGARKV